MTSPVVKGWCPDAWRPMMAGDGLLVRVKPRLGCLTRAQVLGLCDAAVAHGNALIDITARANLQLRGVRETGWQTLLDRGKSSYRRVEVSPDRPNLGTFKSQLTTALKLSDDKAKSAISSAGFKQSTWWEDDKERRDISRLWRE